MIPEYERAVCWIIRNHGEADRKPPAISLTKVNDWAVTHLVADLFKVPVNQVALDIIELYEHARE
jgi:hypothetical protein